MLAVSNLLKLKYVSLILHYVSEASPDPPASCNSSFPPYSMIGFKRHIIDDRLAKMDGVINSAKQNCIKIL